VARVLRSIALLGHRRSRADPWQYLEYLCHACVLWMGWTGQQPAFMDPDYDDQLCRVVEIEHAQRGPDAEAVATTAYQVIATRLTMRNVFLVRV
jgi:hypothetical protein